MTSKNEIPFDTFWNQYKRSGCFAVPASIAEPVLPALQSLGIACQKVEATVGEFHVNVIVFRASEKTSINEISTGVRSVVGDFVACEVCEIEEVEMLICSPRTGVTTFDQDLSQENEEIMTYAAALAAYENILMTLSVVTGGIHFHFHPNEAYSPQAPFPNEPGHIHIFSNAAPPGETGNRYVFQAFGMNINHGRGREPTPGRGIVLSDEVEPDEPLVQVLGANWYLLVPSIGNYSATVSRLVFTKMVDMAWQHHQSVMEQVIPSRPPPTTKTAFIKATRGWVENPDWEIAKGIADAEKMIKEAQRQLAVSFRVKREWEVIMAANAKAPFRTEALERLDTDFGKIESDPHIDRIDIIHRGINIETKPLVIEHNEKSYSIGSFVIRINRQGQVLVWNDSPTHPNMIPHPHISKDGVACFGSATEAITKAASYHRYYDTVTLIIRWLVAGYTPDLAGRKVEEWPLAKGGTHA